MSSARVSHPFLIIPDAAVGRQGKEAAGGAACLTSSAGWPTSRPTTAATPISRTESPVAVRLLLRWHLGARTSSHGAAITLEYLLNVRISPFDEVAEY